MENQILMGDTSYSAVVVGGGFYGASIALYLAQTRSLRRVILLERKPTLMSCASYNNQARIHNGYHYPRSFTTAYRSRVNYPVFLKDFADATKRDFTKVYAIARQHSKVTAQQFAKFCGVIGARLDPAPKSVMRLFNPQLVERCFLVEETAFDSTRLAAWARDALHKAGVEVRLQTQVESIDTHNGRLSVVTSSGGDRLELGAQFIFNCTYSGLNRVAMHHGATPVASLKHEITEMALLKMPEALSGIGVTVMDGPFFSTMPFPARGLHTLSHVRYTPHMNWADEPGTCPYARLDAYNRQTRVDRMVRDASRFMPALGGAQYVDSLWEVKTVLAKNEVDDGRPILLEKSTELPGLFSVLGGKMDNIYDIIEKLDSDTSIVEPTQPS